MEANYQKIIGWVVIFAGLGLITFSVNTSFSYFTGKSDFPPVFKTPAPETRQEVFNDNASLPAGEISGTIDPQIQMQQVLNQATSQAVANALPADSIAKILNLLSWSVFVTFLVFAGAQIAGIGTKLLLQK